MKLCGYMCLMLVIVVHTSADGAAGNTCTKLENKIFDNMLEIMVALKSGRKSKTFDYGNGKNRPAFTATLSPRSTTLSGTSAVIHFDTVILNRGEGYDSKTGLFSAPITGLYQFSATVMAVDSHFHVTIAKNGKATANLYAADRNGATESATIVIELNKGDTVSVMHNVPQSENVFGSNYSFFSGHYISE